MAKKNLSTESTGSRRLGGVSALLSSGRLGLYTENAFRVLGMPVDATDIELQERHDTLKAYATLKRIGEVYTAAFGCKPPPSAHQLDNALERLNDGEQRASDEFFWFWPREFGAENDAGLEAIAEGDAAAALRIWREWEQESGLACAVARHNLAVNYLSLALEQTARHLAGALAKKEEVPLKNAWKNADKRWSEVAGSDHVWAETQKRILSKGDPALTAALVDEMKADLRKTLSSIHGDIARHYAEKNLLEWAKFHVDAMLDNAMLGDQEGFDDDYRATVREVTKPVRDRLEAARAQAQSYADSSDPDRKTQAFAKARDFFENDFEKKAKPALDLFYTGDGALKKERDGLYDKASGTVCNCYVAAFNARQKAGKLQEDDPALMKKALDTATDPNLKERIKKNMSAVASVISSAAGGVSSDPALHEAMKTIAEVSAGGGRPSERFRALQRVRPKLKAWAAKHSGREDCKTIMSVFAKLERSISVALYNQEDNTALAFTAIRCAIEDTPDDADRAKFRDDLATLEIKEPTDIFKRIAESKDDPFARFGQLVKIRPRFQQWADAYPRHEMNKSAMKAFAALERGLSVGMFNEAAEQLKAPRKRAESLELVSMAIFAVCCAIEDTPDEDDRAKYRKDYDQLVSIAEKLGIPDRKIFKPNLVKRPPPAANLVKPPAPAPGLGRRVVPAANLVRRPVPAPNLGGRAGSGSRPGPRRPGIKKASADALSQTFAEFITPVHLWGKFSCAFVFSVPLFLLSLVFHHHYPAGLPLGERVVQWWQFLWIGLVAGMAMPVSRWRPPPPRLLRLQGSWTFMFALTLFLHSFVFRHYYPAGLPVATFVAQWWHLPVLGAVAGLLFPFYRLSESFLLFLTAFNVWGGIVTLLAGLVLAARQAVISEELAAGLWRAPLIGFGISTVIGVMYPLFSKHSKASKNPPPFVAGKCARAGYFAVSLLLLSAAFRHYRPDGLPLLEAFTLQWWQLPVAGLVLGLLLPARRWRPGFWIGILSTGFWLVTLVVWLVMVAHNLIVSEESAWGLWRAPVIGLGICLLQLIVKRDTLKKGVDNQERKWTEIKRKWG
ncbi:MAG: hypothetical protein LBI02_09020 [Opitutaceae bacterium]|jgi:hypothetical protein|nr:hypothetical protein [Opitutaceae bacterium]